jgi:hypothetical protein
MKNLFLVIIFFSLSFLINGCINNSDYSEDLSGHYFYRDEGGHVKDILCHLPNHKEIYSEVIGYSYNKDFIVAVQKPVYEEYRTIIGFNLRSDLKRYPTNSKEEAMQSEKEADSILKHNPFYLAVFKNKLNYWIISNAKQELYGPFTKSEYESKRKELMVPESVQIEYSK